MAKSKKEQKKQLEENKKNFLSKLTTFMLKEGFENVEIAKLQLTFDCNIITDEYCQNMGLIKKEITKNGITKCYCVL